MIILCFYRLRNYGVSSIALENAVVHVSLFADFTFFMFFDSGGLSWFI